MDLSPRLAAIGRSVPVRQRDAVKEIRKDDMRPHKFLMMFEQLLHDRRGLSLSPIVSDAIEKCHKASSWF